MGFLIDTDLWIAVERGRLAAGDIHKVTRQEPVYLSPVNLAEIRFGIDLMTHTGKRKTALAALRRMRRKPLLRITGQTGEVFGRLAAQIQRMGCGHDHRVQDLWLASQAIQRDFTLLTVNEKDFRDYPGLKFLVIRIPRDV